ncbi:MAG: dolichyl-phosphate-mannose-protein mannosyltransferase [Frankiaceae bacterium]|jgi:dolichyl-phosphate-mannose--protein O-mannosyl transferase|nr:dolichyl-phosphate-mannose-protein mannosyltransferase [Frankiaceae bacterium]
MNPVSSAATVAGTTPAPAALTARLARLRPPLPGGGWWSWGIPLVITAVGLFLRLFRITRPHGKVFDETYYAGDAWSLLHHGVEVNSSGRASFVAHPPLGKWVIALGEAMFGNNELGWRFSAAVVGSASILIIARVARRMFRSNLLGCIAALLLSLDGLEFVQSRTSMLDIFLMFWVLAAFGCLVLDRDDGRRRVALRLEHGDALGFLGVRPWRLACGVCLGAAAATKWDGAFWIPVFLLLAVWWDAGARRVAGQHAPVGNAVLYDGLVALVPFVAIPFAVYFASWTGWFLSDGVHAYDHDKYVHAGQSWIAHFFAVLHGWWAYHREMWGFHTHLAAAHPYLSNPLGWLLLARPVAYFYDGKSHACGASACSQEVLGIGTPLIWWLSIPALLAVAWRMIGRFDWRAAAIMSSFLAGYVIWIFDEAQVVSGCHPAGDCHRTMFLFYLLPDVPFMVLALTMAIGMLLATRAVRTVGELFGTMATAQHGLSRLLVQLPVRKTLAAGATALYLAGVTWNFGYFYPILTGQVITYDHWMDRMWLDVCDASPKRDQHHESAPCWI